MAQSPYEQPSAGPAGQFVGGPLDGLGPIKCFQERLVLVVRLKKDDDDEDPQKHEYIWDNWNYVYSGVVGDVEE